MVANAVTALSEISETVAAQQHQSQSTSTASPAVFQLDAATLSKLLIALGECTEWGRIAILSTIARYRQQPSATDTAEDMQKEAEMICERVVPQFQHANPAVVLSAIKVIMIHLKGNTISADFAKIMLRKMAPPLGAYPRYEC